MRLRLTTEDRKYLEEFAHRKVRPTNRQKAQALLGLASGDTPENVAQRVGIKKEDIESLVHTFMERGLRGIGLVNSSRKGLARSKPRRAATIEKTPGVCGAQRGSPAHGSLCGNSSRRAFWVPRKHNS